MIELSMTSVSALLAPQTAAPSGGPSGPMMLIYYIAVFGAIFYFLMIRPQRKQQKEHQERISKLQKGDQVVTTGGVIGEVIYLKDNEVTLKSGESRLVVHRNHITSVTSHAGETKAAS
ncbi:MAG TPA: preprotein translocase subunit YajC [Gemmatimonadales bacterium]|nr:preprotein translocase subunit YajC [Gemmatimonadales bacterium]